MNINCFIGETIYLRLFELADYEFTYKWRNDYNIQKMTCGPIRYVSREIERNWVHSKECNNAKDIYLAICLKDNDEMIGYYSINNIDLLNRKCHCGGIVIGNPNYRDGVAYNEVIPIVRNYLFNELNMHRITGSCLKEHITSRATMEANGYTLEGIERDSIFKGGKYHDICIYSLLEEEYRMRIEKPLSSVEYAKKFVEISRRIKKELKNNI